MDAVHTSVLATEVVSMLQPANGRGLLIDGTVGEGGHSACFLQQFPHLRVIGVDADAEILARAGERLRPFGDRVQLRHDWFDTFFSSYTGAPPDRVLLDLGISMYHLRMTNRGFSFRADGPLDMRLNASAEVLSAADVIAQISEEDLASIIYRYGEERYSRSIARRICAERRESPITTTARLEEIVWRSVPKSYRHGKVHPATRTFQALRIAVNRELERVERTVQLVPQMLAQGGRMGVISFHSLEDRIVKTEFRVRAMEPQWRTLTKKPIVPTDEEVGANPAARSAKFRVLERVTEVAA